MFMMLSFKHIKLKRDYDSIKMVEITATITSFDAILGIHCVKLGYLNYDFKSTNFTCMSTILKLKSSDFSSSTPSNANGTLTAICNCLSLILKT